MKQCLTIGHYIESHVFTKTSSVYQIEVMINEFMQMLLCNKVDNELQLLQLCSYHMYNSYRIELYTPISHSQYRKHC